MPKDNTVAAKAGVATTPHPETEEELIARIKSGNGMDDEYTDKYGKPFPR